MSWTRAIPPRWVNRLGGSLAIAIVLFQLAMRLWVMSPSDVTAWSMAWVFPVGFAAWMSLEWLIGSWFGRLAARINRHAQRRFEVLVARNIPILVDWSVPALLVAVVPAGWFAPAIVASAVGCELLVLLVHELGHAAVVRRFDGQVVSIEISVIHGRVHYFSPRRVTPPVAVAWGGVVAQMLVAIPASLFWLDATGGDPLSRHVALFVLGPWNALTAGLNLLPIPGLDGATVWKGLRRSRYPSDPRAKGGWNS